MSVLFTFDHPHDVPARQLGNLLGGKGAGLAEMTAALGFSVPPGFTVALPACRDYMAHGWPDYLDAELDAHVRSLGDVMGRHLGDPDDPLLVAVRSGAPVSMPGMLDTVLNLGLNRDTVAGLARRSQDEAFAWDSYCRFLTMYAVTVMGVDEEALTQDPAARRTNLEDRARALSERVERLAGRRVPDDPGVQLREAVEAVFRSWGSPRAKAYRAREGISDDLGTGVNVQAMVFGNRGPDSGTGVVFTRDPATGAPGPYGDYLPRAQGEDVVSGRATTMPVTCLEDHHPAAYSELLRVIRRLEVHYRDVCDVEFTVEAGRLWLLQTRIGKRGAVAAVKIAVDLVDDPDIALSPAEALTRVPADVRERARAEVTAHREVGGDASRLLTTGLGASPGRVSGRLVLTAEDAVDAEEAGDAVILVRRETSPEDVAGMAASAGVLTTRGGLVSHAAVVARGWGLPAVVGAEGLELDAEGVTSPDGVRLLPGEMLTIDGSSGNVWSGVVNAHERTAEEVAEALPELARLEEWARRTAPVPT